MESKNYLNFSEIKPIVDIQFWLKFTQLKLDDWKLKCPPVDIHGVISLPLSQKASSDLMIQDFTSNAQKGGLLEFQVPGKFIHFNTIEEYQAFDFGSLSEEKYSLKNFDQCVKEGQNYFVLVCFGDLKNYNYHYKIAMVQGKEQIETTKGKKLIKQVSKEELETMCQVVQKNLSNERQYFEDGDYIYFFDNSPLHPSVLLNNVLQRYLSEFRNGELDRKVQKIILIKEKLSESSENVTLNNSFYCEVVFEKQVGQMQGGYEIKEVTKKVINLKDQLDTKLIVENAADLNLKLMKWRQAPSLDLDILQKTSCLLLGSGSLGCQVARNLVSWGYRKITFVDSGKVSYSNPVRQCLFTYEDSIKENNFKAPIAAERLKEVFPMVETRGEVLKIPMPGHAVGSNEEAIKEVQENRQRLEDLIKEHDVILLLLDSRESRWLPTVLSGIHNKICMTIALGFETYLAMRHGLSEKVHDKEKNGARLGCYFCNDVVAPRNSLQDRSLDQQCTVSRPALCCMASSLGVELLTSIMNHPLKNGAIARENAEECDRSSLGIIPQQLRGDLHTFSMSIMYGECFDKCIGCSGKIAEAYEANPAEFLIKACNDPNHLEDVTGITAMNEAINIDDIEALSDVEWD